MTNRERAERSTGKEPRTRLIEAAVRLIAREGVSAATTRRVAAEAGVPNGTFHYWFADKQDLLKAVIGTTFADLRSAAIEHHPGSDPRAMMKQRLEAVFEVVRTDQPGQQLASYELTALALRSEDMRHLAVEQYQGYRAAAREALDGWDHPLPSNVDTVGAFLAALVDGLALAWLADPDGTPLDAILTLTAEMLTTQGGAGAGPRSE